MARPKIIMHMHTSLNGKINGPHLRTKESQTSQVEYYNLILEPDPLYRELCGWLSGSTVR